MTAQAPGWVANLERAFDGMAAAHEIVTAFADKAAWAARTARKAADQSVDPAMRRRLARLGNDYQDLGDNALAVCDSLEHVSGFELMGLLQDALELQATE